MNKEPIFIPQNSFAPSKSTVQKALSVPIPPVIFPQCRSLPPSVIYNHTVTPLSEIYRDHISRRLIEKTFIFQKCHCFLDEATLEDETVA